MTTGIDFQTIKQGSQPRVTFFWPLLETHEPQDFTGMTISATMYDTTTQLVTAVTGALTVIDGATREIEWAMTDTDTGTDGRFWITFLASGAGEQIYSLYGKLDIESNQAINAVGNPPLVGIPVNDAVWVAAARPLNDPPQTWAAATDIRPLATQAEAEAGTDNLASMSPLRTAQAIAVQSITDDDYAAPTVGGTLKARLDGTTLYLTNDGSDA